MLVREVLAAGVALTLAVGASVAGAAAGQIQEADAASGCLASAPAKLVVVHLAAQELDAYDGGCPLLQTPVTTGRPALPTLRGTLHIFNKAPSYTMVSPWPRGSPYWYPTTTVSWAMEFISNGTFLHGASWQPAGTYGAGSEYGPYASHGCVHVPPGPLQQLYNWAPIGTTVTVEG